MKIIKHVSCNNRVKLNFILIYSITNYKVNSTKYSIIMAIQTIKYIQQITKKEKKTIDFMNEKCLS